MKNKNLSRRTFIQNSGVGLAMGATAVAGPAAALASTRESDAALPREVWVATLAQQGMTSSSYTEMTEQVLEALNDMKPVKPDIICLPETFPFAVNPVQGSVKEVAEKPLGPITQPFADFARDNGCYVICPTYTEDQGRYYNAAVVIDREGRVVGEYRKIHPTIGEVEMGLDPGPIDPPVFKTDFGLIGIQICFDINWDDAWNRLSQKGAEIVFWPSAFAGGQQVNTMAWKNKYVVVSSTNKDTAKISDISGQTIATTERWNPRWVCAPVNLEKVFLHTWPYVQRFAEIKAKYGRKVSITNYGEEEWSIIESLSPDLKVEDIMSEFDLKSHKEHIQAADEVQVKARS